MTGELSKLLVGKRRDTLVALFGETGLSPEGLIAKPAAARQLVERFRHLTGISLKPKRVALYIRNEQKGGRWVALYRRPSAELSEGERN